MRYVKAVDTKLYDRLSLGTEVGVEISSIVQPLASAA